jgi:two-component system cell cycle response regulator
LIMMLTASGLSLALVARSQKLLQMATSDPLTGLFNRGYVDDRLAIEFSRARRYGKLLTIAVVDVDRFKSLNDTHGHSAGDAVLRQIGAILRNSFRQSDTAGRYGGEEFVIILPETDIESAQQRLESLRESITTTPIELGATGEKVQVTISAGLASFPQDGITPQSCLRWLTRECSWPNGKAVTAWSPHLSRSSLKDFLRDSQGRATN